MDRVAVVIPCYKVRKHILEVIKLIGDEVQSIYVIDDCCPEGTGDYVDANKTDARVVVIRHASNMGVGGSVLTGYERALSDGADIVVKIDGDGQMDPSLINNFVDPIARGEADYTKGNRFYNLEKISSMPKVRLFGNAVLSFMAKFSSGYWNVFDPTNGYTAIHRHAIQHLPLGKISKRYFFESDMLFRLNTFRAVVVDIPMDACYEDEVSNLNVSKVVGEFFAKHVRNYAKRIFYNYYLRDMSIASLELPVGVASLVFGLTFGFYNWGVSMVNNVETSSGTVMLSALPIIIGFQLILAFLNYDISTVPSRVLHRKYENH